MSALTTLSSSYDSDNTTWSPMGRLHQVEYALEAVKQGSASVGLRSKTHVILLALKVRVLTSLHELWRSRWEVDKYTGYDGD